MPKPEIINRNNDIAAVPVTIAGYDIAGIVYERLAVERMNFDEDNLSNAQERQARIRVYNKLLRDYRRRLNNSDFYKFRIAAEKLLFTQQERFIK